MEKITKRKQLLIDRVYELVNFCQTPKLIEEISDFMKVSSKRARFYLSLLSLKKVIKTEKQKRNVKGRCNLFYFATGKEPTKHDVYFVLDEMKKIHRGNYYGDRTKVIKQIEVKEEVTKYENIEENVKSEDELNGIYRLSSAPSQHFLDKFKAQSELIVKERKSPRNYPGTSAGMVW